MSRAIILAAGSINLTLLPITSSNSTSLIPINGKPAISHIIDDLISRGISTISVVIRKKDHQLEEFIRKMYVDKIEIKIVPIVPKTIIFSLEKGLESLGYDENILVVLGDTLIKDKLNLGKESFVCTSYVKDFNRWCSVVSDSDNKVTDYYDKIQDNHNVKKVAIAGYYYFSNSKTLQVAIKKVIDKNKHQISDVLKEYAKTEFVYSYNVKKWFDFGNIDNLIKAKRTLTQSRYFNLVKIDSNTVTITKTSSNQAKLNDEISWYQSLPDDLQPFTPRIYRVGDKKLVKKSITLEYYGYPTLSELYLYSNLNMDAWRVIIDRVMEVHKLFIKHKGKCTKSDVEKIYLTKTFERIKDAQQRATPVRKFLKYTDLYINNNHYLGLDSLTSKVSKYIKSMSARGVGRIVHGDYCFSNILFDYFNQIVKLIDPRGSFGAKGIYGDPKYDIAKLRHSVHGNYDHIMNSMYKLDYHNNHINYSIFVNDLQEKIVKLLDEKIIDLGYDIKDIKVIEGLLFISMIPLHAEDKNRQIMFFARGIVTLNEALL